MKRILALACLGLLATVFGGCSAGASGMVPTVQTQSAISYDSVGGGPLHRDSVGGGPLHGDSVGGGPLHHNDSVGGGPLHSGRQPGK